MTVSALPTVAIYSGNDSTTEFAVPCHFDANSEIVCTLLDLAGLETTLVLDTHFTVTGAGTASGIVTYPKVTVPVTPPLATGTKLVVQRILPLTQTNDMTARGDNHYSGLELSLDKAEKKIQQLENELDRCAKYRVSNTDSPPDLEDLETVTETDQVKVIQFTLFGSDESVVTGDSVSFAAITATFNGWTVVACRATNVVKGVTGTTSVLLKKKQISDDTIVDVLSTAVTLGDERTAADGVIDTTKNTLLTGDILYPSVSTVHSGTAPLGMGFDVTIQAP